MSDHTYCALMCPNNRCHLSLPLTVHTIVSPPLSLVVLQSVHTNHTHTHMHTQPCASAVIEICSSNHTFSSLPSLPFCLPTLTPLLLLLPTHSPLSLFSFQGLQPTCKTAKLPAMKPYCLPFDPSITRGNEDNDRGFCCFLV